MENYLDVSFNPLDRGNYNQMNFKVLLKKSQVKGFNPLDRGNYNQIHNFHTDEETGEKHVSIP